MKRALGKDEIGLVEGQLERLERALEMYRSGIAGSARDIRAKVVAIKYRPVPNGKVKPTLFAAWQAPAAPSIGVGSCPEMPAQPSPGWSNASADDPTVIAILVFGLRDAALDAAIDLVIDTQRRGRSFAPVFLTDSADLRTFLNRGYAFEYFPSKTYRTESGSVDWSRAFARIRFIYRKWGVAGAMDLSAPDDLALSPMAAGGDARDARQAEAGAAGKARGTPRKATSGKETRSRAARARASELDRLAAMVRASGLFDEAWYLEMNPDVARSGADPVMHYIEAGAAEGRNPHPLFDTNYYGEQLLRSRSGSRSSE